MLVVSCVGMRSRVLSSLYVGKDIRFLNPKTVQEIIENDGIVIILFVDMYVKVAEENCGEAVIYFSL